MNEIFILSLVCCGWPLVVHFAINFLFRAKRQGVRFRSPVVIGQQRGFTGSGQKPKN